MEEWTGCTIGAKRGILVSPFFPILYPKERGPVAGLAASNWVGWIQDRLHLGLEEPVQIFWSPGSAHAMQSSLQT